MNYCCDWCGEWFDSDIDGIIKMSEHHQEYAHDEFYFFCTYKCLGKWLAL